MCGCGQHFDNERALRIRAQGKRHPMSGILFCTECIAGAMARCRLKVITATRQRVPDDAREGTVVDRALYVQRTLLEEGLAPRSVHQYTRTILRAASWCEANGVTLDDVAPHVLADYVALVPRTKASRAVLRAALANYWRVMGRQDPPTWVVRAVKGRRMVCKALDGPSAAALAERAAARGDLPGFAVLLALYQALRREEIATLRWDAFDDDGWMTVVGKGEVEARLPVHPVVATALERLPRTGAPWIFPGQASRRNTHVTPSTIWSWVSLVATEVGLIGVSTHVLRHTALATANDKTGDLRATQDFARHANVATTTGYTPTTKRRLEAVAYSIDYEEVEALRIPRHGEVDDNG